MVTGQWFSKLALGFVLAIGFALQSYASTSSEGRWQNVQHVIGFEGVAPESRGDLSVGEKGIAFRAGDRSISLALEQVESASLGSERQETGGRAGKITRVLVPYGGGALVGLATQRGVGLLAIRYRDLHQGLHEALLSLPEEQAVEVQQHLSTLMLPAARGQIPARLCGLQAPSPAIRIAVDNDDKVQPEYEAAIFEHLVADVQSYGLKR